ncbi:MAG: hypothetical protein JWR69_882 [Pedosphaera sp.]|nr:hypothetical protein [Pedosphaera sp.]
MADGGKGPMPNEPSPKESPSTNFQWPRSTVGDLGSQLLRANPSWESFQFSVRRLGRNLADRAVFSRCDRGPLALRGGSAVAVNPGCLRTSDVPNPNEPNPCYSRVFETGRVNNQETKKPSGKFRASWNSALQMVDRGRLAGTLAPPMRLCVVNLVPIL